MQNFKKKIFTTILSVSLLIGSLPVGVEAAPLWYKNYLEGKTTKAGTVNSDNENTQITEPIDQENNIQDKTTQEINDYWRNRYKSNKPTTPSTPQEQIPDSNTGENLAGVLDEEMVLFELLNQERINRGLNPLKLNSALTQLARLKARDMAENNYFSHTSPTYGGAADMVKNAGISYWIVGENIAITSSGERANSLFMGSSSHRAAMLNKLYSEVGIGMYRKENGSLYVAEIFIGVK